MEYNPITVTDLNKYIKDKIDGDEFGIGSYGDDPGVAGLQYGFPVGRGAQFLADEDRGACP